LHDTKHKKLCLQKYGLVCLVYLESAQEKGAAAFHVFSMSDREAPDCFSAAQDITPSDLSASFPSA
jgi:hypothetical protein